MIMQALSSSSVKPLSLYVKILLFLIRGRIDGASGNITIDPPKVRGISFTKLSGILNSSVLFRMRKENIVRIAFRLLTPFFLSDHIPCDYKTMLNVHRKHARRTPLTTKNR